MAIKEGDLVVITGKLDNRIRAKSGLTIGTFMWKNSDKQIAVLLPDGDIFYGKEYDIAAYEEQKEVTP